MINRTRNHKISWISLLLLCYALLSCNVPTSEIPPTETIWWEEDGEGFLQFCTNDRQNLEHLFVVWDDQFVDPMQDIDVEVKKVSGNPWGAFGIVFCVKDNRNYYILGIDTNGYYMIWEFAGGNWVKIMDWTYTHLLNKGYDSTNRLQISYEPAGSTFTVRLNTAVVTSFSDFSLSGGYTGFLVEVMPGGLEHFPHFPVDARFRYNAKIAVDPMEGLVTSEAGGTDSFTVVLGAEPSADVLIPLSSDDPYEGTASPSSLTFTPVNWSVPQTVTVTGVDDADTDGDQPYMIVLSPTQSTDPKYDEIDPHDVSVRNRDNEVCKLLSPQPETYASLGSSVAIAGDHAVVGAPGEDPGGAAYIFHRIAENIWDAGTKITAPDVQNNDSFGKSVAIHGDYVIVGAPKEDDGGSDAGAVYVFHRTGLNTWDYGTKISAVDSQAGDEFGCSVGIHGDYTIVGAIYEEEGGSDAGAAYVFHRAGGTTWDSGVKLLSPDIAAYDFFGCSVAISGDYAIVGASDEDEGGNGAGAAYIFKRTDTNTWDGGAKILAPDAEGSDNFGRSVAIDGSYAIVGAEGEDQGGSGAGAAYVFYRDVTDVWDAGTKIVAPDAQSSDQFGLSVAISGDAVIVGARGEDQGGTDAGAAYLFRRTDTNAWDVGTKIVAHDSEAYDWFGSAVGISAGYMIIGSSREDEGEDGAGAVYTYFRP